MPAAGPTGAAATTKLIVYVDGCALGNPGEGGLGVVIAAPEGDVLWAVGEPLGHTTNNVAEYRALLRGLAEAKRLGATAVQVYTDSELVAKQIAGEYRVKRPHLKPLFAEAQRRLAGFASATLTHVPRERNAEADRLALRAARTGRPVVPDLANHASPQAGG
jgi:ribonuclease HI